jgi:hypothetical protein
MAPRTWVLLGDKGGDNGQVETLVQALGWPVERRFLQPLPEWVYGKPTFRPSLSHLDPERSDALEAPWPDLIITCGRRPSMAALWIKAQSGGRTRIILVGKPSGHLHDFDLIVASSENQLPPFPHVLRTLLPFMRVDVEAVDRAARDWAPRLAELPRPLVAFLVGGETNPFVMDATVAERLLAQGRRVLAEGGTPYFCTSRRTTPAVLEVLRRALPDGAMLYTWSPDAAPADNPYRALLGLADRFVVTADSISMQVEVLRLGRPLAIFPLPSGRFGAVDGWRRRLASWLNNPEGSALRRALARGLFRIDRLGLLSLTRDFRTFHRALYARGLAHRVDDPPPVSGAAQPDAAQRYAAQPDADDLSVAVARIRALLPPATR